MEQLFYGKECRNIEFPDGIGVPCQGIMTILDDSKVNI